MSQTFSVMLPDPEAVRAAPLRAWRREDKRKIAVHFARAIQAWLDDWSVTPSLHDAALVQVQDPHDDSPPEAQWQPMADAAMLWRYVRGEGSPAATPPDETAPVLALRRMIFGVGDDDKADSVSVEGSPLSLSVARRAWRDFAARLATLAGGVEALAPMPMRSPVAGGATVRTSPDRWSGALRLHTPWLGGRLEVQLTHRLASNWIGSDTSSEQAGASAAPAEAPERLELAIAPSSIRLHAVLDAVTLRLGDLLCLRPGDLVTLPHALSAPAQLITDDGRALFQAWLGQADGHVAVELSAPPASVATQVAAVSTIQ